MPRIYLHIGAPKTGTTYLQTVLHTNRSALAAAGVLYPGDDEAAHYEAVLDLRGLAFGGYHDPRTRGAWERLVRQALQWGGDTVVISHELLAGADEDAVERAVRSFGDSEVHVIYTARDLKRQVPAMWQESVKNKQHVGFPRFLRQLTREKVPRGPARIFWRQQHAGNVLAKWAALVPPERIHVITVPPAGAPGTALWGRFAMTVGIVDVEVETSMTQANTSLAYPQAELLRRVNEALAGELGWDRYAPTVKFWFAEQVLASQGGAPRAAIPQGMLPWFSERADQIVAAVRAAGYDVVGDLEELQIAAKDEDAPRNIGADEADVADAAVETLATLLRLRIEERERHTLTRLAHSDRSRGMWRYLPAGARRRLMRRLRPSR